jgi:hypothetical protein
MTKQFAIVVDKPAHNGGRTSVINPPPPNYTYSMLEMQKAMKLLHELYPEAHIEAHEVAYIDHHTMPERWSKARLRG